MKKQLLSVLFIAACLTSYAQVGVGTDSPTTTLHVDAPTGLTTSTGVTIPVVTDDMTTTSVNGTEVSQLVYSSHANSTGFYFWDGAAWSALRSSSGDALNYTSTNNANYAVQATDDIIEYTSGAAGNFTLPNTPPIGKVFYFASTAGGQMSFADVVTQAANTISANTGAALIHLGSGRYASLQSF